MIAIDTNVLLRYLLQDDAKQSAKAAALLAGEEDVLVTYVVLSETLWTLCGKKYNATQSDVSTTVRALFEEPRIVFENAKTVWRALGDYVKVNEKTRTTVDFPDALILNCAKQTADQKSVDFNGFYTF
ncbi:MAG: PIN domain-containing protein, partial [Rhodothermales bacterium]|nr:PIN domain-containing protein [Rhodothermales bacterium]